eukprot:TRINITY_DN16377_c0_g1_i3.p1 TRINITY_DN16377_c0_g1~~TRINITY_DN16377_c0_g1_i3.p1  ORF type:complete len:104 (+),score=20.54 TRINITY_DN16377_c0_g1_i3:74-385(+)
MTTLSFLQSKGLASILVDGRCLEPFEGTKGAVSWLSYACIVGGVLLGGLCGALGVQASRFQERRGGLLAEAAEEEPGAAARRHDGYATDSDSNDDTEDTTISE